MEDDLNNLGVIRFRLDDVLKTTLQAAGEIGSIAEIPGVSSVQPLVPKSKKTASASSYSGIYGRGAFPLHTDMAHWSIPPRYLMLRCVTPDPNIKTTVLHSREILDGEDPVDLARSLFRPRRRLDGRLTVLRLREKELVRWDPVFLNPINSLAVGLSKRVAERISRLVPMELPLDAPGDCLILDNWNVLHGRTSAYGEASARYIERVYLTEVSL